MSADEPTRAVKLFGTTTVDPEGRELRAGALSAVLDSGALRYIRVGDVEVLRAIAFLVRDENWGTYTPQIDNLKIAEGDAGFAVTYGARCSNGKNAITYKAQIACSPAGNLQFEVVATPETDFPTNRTGFIVLHPLKGVAGHPVEVEHVDGRKVSARFPEVIDPVQPFFDIRSLTHQVQPGLEVTCSMQGDAFEMEDQRNWTDASFKTYVRPLSKPWPYTLPAGETFTQSVSLRFSAPLPAVTGGVGSRATDVTVGAAARVRLPSIGLGVSADEAGASLAAADLVRSAHVRTLVCQMDGRRGDLAETAKRYARLAAASDAGVSLEIVLPAKASPAAELAPIAKAATDAGLRPTAIAVSLAPYLKSIPVGRKGPAVPSFEETYAAARSAFPGVPLGGGMLSYFTELNRIRPPAELIDFITHTTCPIVHAADDVSVMETLQALPYIIQSTRAFAGGKGYRVGPSAIPARDNPYGPDSAENPRNQRVCLSRMDPRQRGLFGAAWTLGYIAAFAKGGLDVVSIGSVTGPSGVVYRKMDTPQPYFDAGGAAVYPAYHVIAGLAADAGAELSAATSSNDAVVVALAYRTAKGPVLWLANLTAAEQDVAVHGLGSGGLIQHRIDETTFVAATSRPDLLAGPGQQVAAGAPVTLSAYAVVRLKPAR